VDAWQNQRFKPLQGGWTKPYGDMTPQFSDLTALKTVDFATINGNPVPVALLPSGWEYTSEWEVDMSGKFGGVDKDGWSYATSFETLFDNSVKQKSDGEMARFSLVRRRRWIRQRACVSAAATAAFEARVQYMNAFRYQLARIAQEKEKEYGNIVLYHKSKLDLLHPVVKYAARGLSDTVQVLEHIAKKLLLVREYLFERGQVEMQHAKRLEEMGKKWQHCGAVPPTLQKLASMAAPSETPPSAPAPIAAGKGVEAVAKPPEATVPGFFTTVGESDLKIAAHMLSYSSMLTDFLPQDVDAVLEKIQSIIQDCQNEGGDLAMAVATYESGLEAAFDRCQNSMRVGRQDAAERGAALLNSLSVVSAAQGPEVMGSDFSEYKFNQVYEEDNADAATHVEMTTITPGMFSFSSISPTSSSADATPVENSKVDLFLAIKHYHRCANKADSAVTIYSAFTKQQRREARSTANRVQTLLQATLKVFSHEQRRMWEDIMQDLNSLQAAQRRATVSANQTFGTSHALKELPPGTAAALAASQLEDEEYSSLCNPVFPRAPRPLILAHKGKLCVAVTKTTKAGVNPIQEVNASYYYSHLLKLLTVPVAGSKAEATYKWLPVTAVVTYDGSLLLYEAFEGDDDDDHNGKDDEASAAEDGASANSTNSSSAAAKKALAPEAPDTQKWYQSDALLRLSLRSADVEPLLTLGLDVFVIKATAVLASRSSFTSSLPTSTSSKTSAALLAESSNMARKWLQICSHPTADADMEPPALYAEP